VTARPASLPELIASLVPQLAPGQHVLVMLVTPTRAGKADFECGATNIADEQAPHLVRELRGYADAIEANQVAHVMLDLRGPDPRSELS